MRIQSSILTLLLLSTACNRTDPAKQPQPGSSSPGATGVKFAKPVKKALTRPIEQPGSVIAEKETPLFAKVAGFVKNYHFDIGQRVEGPKYERVKNKDGEEVLKEVKSGVVLADIVIPELEAESRQKQALKKQAEQELKQSRQTFEIAKESVKVMNALVLEASAGLKRAEANYKRWDSEKVRIAKLVSDKTIEPQIGDETINQWLAADAARDEANARVATAKATARKSEIERDKSEADIEVAQAKLQVAEAEAERLESLISYTRIRAPFDGIVTKRKVDAGHFVQPAGTPKAEPLFTVAKIDTVRVVVDVPEADANLVKPGNEIHIVVPALRGAPIISKVARTSGSLDPVSRTLRTEVDLPNAAKKLDLTPGMYVHTRILAQLPESYLLPAAAVIKVGESMICYRVEGKKAVRALVKVGRSDGVLIEVFKRQKPGDPEVWEDWTGDEIVAASNTAYLVDGQSVEESSK